MELQVRRKHIIVVEALAAASAFLLSSVLDTGTATTLFILQSASCLG
jgi:hypothetical protein